MTSGVASTTGPHRERPPAVIGAILAGPPAAVIRVTQLVLGRPSILAALTLLLLCVPASPNAEQKAIDVTPADVGAVVLVALVAARLPFVRSRISLSRGIVVGVVASLVAYFVTTVTATDYSTSIAGLVRYVEIFVVVPIAVALSIERRSDAVLILGALVVVGVFEGALGAYQYVTGTGAGYGPEGVRAVGTFGAYDIMGMATVVSCALLVVLAVTFGGRGHLRRLAVVVVPFLALALALSLSRGAWLASLGAAATIALLSGIRRFLVGLAVVVLVSLAAVGVLRPDLGVVGLRASSVLASSTSPDRSVHDRYDLWTAALGMWRDHPIAGVGMKNFPLWRDNYAPVSLSSGSDISDPQGGSRRVELLSPHNQYLLILSEQGVLGFAGYGLLMLAVIAGTLRWLLRAPPGKFEQVLGLFSAGVLVRYLIANLWGDLGGPTNVMTAVLLGVAFWYASGGAARVRGTDSDRLPARLEPEAG